jgi:hypothetical protein
MALQATMDSAGASDGKIILNGLESIYADVDDPCGAFWLKHAKHNKLETER